ncbi:MAG: hypothetical protein V3T02_07890 [Alphaproteobacteria bacterium]
MAITLKTISVAVVLIWLAPLTAADNAPKGTKAVFSLASRDIVDIVADGTGDLRLMLTPRAAQRFEDFTWRFFGELVKVTAGGKVLVEAVVRAPVTTGVIVVTTKGATDAAETLRLLKKQ